MPQIHEILWHCSLYKVKAHNGVTDLFNINSALLHTYTNTPCLQGRVLRGPLLWWLSMDFCSGRSNWVWLSFIWMESSPHTAAVCQGQDQPSIETFFCCFFLPLQSLPISHLFFLSCCFEGYSFFLAKVVSFLFISPPLHIHTSIHTHTRTLLLCWAFVRQPSWD